MELEDAWLHAVSDAILYGHGFIIITNNNGMEVNHVKRDEYDDIIDLLKFIKENT